MPQPIARAAAPTVDGGDAARDGVARGFYALAFLSGVAALVYEVTWAKMLALTFGSTTLAAAAVVAGFLGGMGLGAALYHRIPGHDARPLRVYALLELAIAASAAAFSAVVYALPERFAALAQGLESDAALAAVRMVLVLAMLLVPAFLMGATFPALCRGLIEGASGVDRRLGWIYGINTLGAATGALLAGLVLIERLGLRGSSLAAIAINVAVALGALALERRARPAAGSAPAAEGEDAIPTALPRAVTGFVLFLSGFCTLGYEIVWFRGLRYLVGASTYAFSIVLFTFLVGLGLGSLLLKRAAARRSPERDLLLVQCLIAVLAVGAIALQAFVLSDPDLARRLSVFVPEVRLGAWQRRLALDAAVAVVTLLPATIFMGLSFPLATRLFLGDVRRLDRGVGRAYLIANVGSILGTVGGALVLLPYLGTIGGTKACAALNLAAAAAILLALRGRVPGGGAWLASAAAVVVAASFALPRSLPMHGEELAAQPGVEEIHLEEGDVATVKVQRDRANPAKLEMSIDGYKIGWSEGYRGTPLYQKQLLLADLPLVIDERVRRAVTIGLGSGATLAELARDPRLASIECVEINGSVVRAARLFPEWRATEDPRVRVAVDDAVHFLLRSRERYDLVASDGKQDPFFAGNADLLCLEFYEYARERLSAHGMVVQWFPLGTLASDLDTVIATLCAAFPEVDAFWFPPFSVILVAGVEPLSARPILPAGAFAALPAGESFRSWGFAEPEHVLAHWVAGRGRLSAAVAGAPVSRWDRQILDVSPFRASGEEWGESVYRNARRIVGAAEPPSPTAGPRLSPPGLLRLEATRLAFEGWLALLEERKRDALAHFQAAHQKDASYPLAHAMVVRLSSELGAPR